MTVSWLEDPCFDLESSGWPAQVLEVLCSAREYDELPVRHNEDKLNTTLCGLVRFPPDTRTADDPHTKANLLLQVSIMQAQSDAYKHLTDRVVGWELRC